MASTRGGTSMVAPVRLFLSTIAIQLGMSGGFACCDVPQQPINATVLTKPLAEPLPAGVIRLQPEGGKSTGAILCVAFSPDGKLAAAAGDDHAIHLFDVA